MGATVDVEPDDEVLAVGGLEAGGLVLTAVVATAGVVDACLEDVVSEIESPLAGARMPDLDATAREPNYVSVRNSRLAVWWCELTLSIGRRRSAALRGHSSSSLLCLCSREHCESDASHSLKIIRIELWHLWHEGGYDIERCTWV